MQPRATSVGARDSSLEVLRDALVEWRRVPNNNARQSQCDTERGLSLFYVRSELADARTKNRAQLCD